MKSLFVFREDALSAEKQKNRTVAGLMIMVAVFFTVLIVFSIYTVQIFKSSDEKIAFGSKSDLSKSVIGVVELNGAIMQSKPTIELIEKAERNKKVKAIIIRVNSPGGAVAPTQEIYQEMRRIDQEYSDSKGERSKPVYVSFSTVAASGGYYLGAAGRKICSLPGTMTGSIGVIMQFMDLSKAYEFLKINPQTVKAGRYKDIGNPSRSMSDEEKSLMTAMTVGVHKQFIEDIKKTRGKKIKGDLNEIAQGQIFSGQQAYELGLVDELSGLWGCARNIHKELKFEDKLNLKFIKKKKKFKLMDMLEDLEEVSSSFKEILSMVGTPVLMFK